MSDSLQLMQFDFAGLDWVAVFIGSEASAVKVEVYVKSTR
jgi:hypothetical protein